MKQLEERVKLQREYHDSEAEVQPVLFLYGDSVENLCGTLTIINGVDFASVSTLRQEITEQKEAIQNGFDRYGNECDLY